MMHYQKILSPREHNMFSILNSSLTHQVLLLVQTRVEFITTGDYFESRGASHVSISVATVVIIILYPYTVTIFWTCIFSEMQRIVHNTIERASRYWRTAEFFNNFVVICKFKVYKNMPFLQYLLQAECCLHLVKPNKVSKKLTL